MKKLLQKFTNTTLAQKIQLFMWILSLVVLLVFVILAASLTKGTASYANTLAAVGTVFGILLISSLFTTAIMSYRNGMRGGK